MAAKQTKQERDEEQRDKINRMDFTINEVIQPSLKRVETTLLTLEQKDYMTKVEADTKYLTKADFKPYAVILGTLGAAIVTAVGLALARVILK